jgi:hypothetical protein
VASRSDGYSLHFSVHWLPFARNSICCLAPSHPTTFFPGDKVKRLAVDATLRAAAPYQRVSGSRTATATERVGLLAVSLPW